MMCPKCNAPMGRAVHNGIEIDRCSGCKGLWFDAGELGSLSLMEDAEMLDLGSSAVGSEFDSLHDVACPRCIGATLKPMRAKDHEHVLVDACPQCQGVFLDAGEFTTYKQTGFIPQLRSLYARLVA